MVDYGLTLRKEISSSTATLLLQIVFILVMCGIIGRVMFYLKQPPVVGEIIAGIIMGPSVLGQIAAYKTFMFPPAYQIALKGISDLGIVFFMFIMGLEFNPVEVLKSARKTWMIGLASILLPFSLGAAIATFMYDQTDMATTNPSTPFVAFVLFTGASMSFTAFPVLARILTANNALTAQIGLVAMGVSSMDDALAWTVLAIATSYQTGGAPENGAWGILLAIAWIIFLLVVVRRGLQYIRPRVSEPVFLVINFVGLCTSAWFTQVLGLHAFFGGFIFGVCVPKEDREWSTRLVHELEIVICNFFVPIFFCNTGLNTDFSQLKSAAGPIFLVIFCAAAGKMLPPLFLGRFLRKYSWPFSFQLASLMNARGLVELIALTIAKESGAFNMKMYSVFVIMALTTTFMSGPMFYFSYDPKKDPPAALRASRLSPEQPVQLQPEPELEVAPVTCVEIPKEEQLDAAAAHQFSGYMYTGKTEQPSARGEAPKIWNESEPVSRFSATTASSASSSAGDISHQALAGDVEAPEPVLHHENVQ